MDTWPPTIVCNSTQGVKNRKGKVKATILPYPLLEGGALTSATLREDGNRLEWVTAQGRASSRKLVCNKEAILAFPATQSPHLRPQTTSLLQRAEQGAHFLRTYYPDVDIPAELIREQLGVEARLEDSLRVFDPLVGDLVTSFHVCDGSKQPRGFIAFPMGESGCDLNFSNIDFTVEGNIITEPSHSPVKTFETPIRQIVSSPVSSDLAQETVVGVRTFSSTSFSSLSLPTSKQRKTSTFVETKEIGSINSSSLDGHVVVDVQIHSSLEYATLVDDQGHVFRQTLTGSDNPVKVFGGFSDPDDSNDGFWRIAMDEHKETCLLMSSKSVQLVDFRVANRGVEVYSAMGRPDLLTSIKCHPDDSLSRVVTTNELVWVDPRFRIKPILAWKHEREGDRTLSSHAVGIGGATFTVLSSRKNSLLSVYAVSNDKDSLLQSHVLPYSLSGRFPRGPHAGFYVTHPHPQSGDASAASLIQLTSRGALYQTALTVCQNEETPSPITIDVSWSSAVHRLATTSSTQQPDVGKLGARSLQEVDFRQVYQRLFYPLDSTEAVYPAENASAVYQTLDVMPLFWQEANTAHEHMLTTFDIAFRSGEEPTHASRADFLMQSALSSRRGFRALVQGRVPREILIKGAAWHVNLGPVLQKFVPDIAEDVQTIVERLHRYDLIVDDYRSGSSLRRESESREQLAVDLALSTDVYSAQSFSNAKAETDATEDDKFDTMSRAAEAMTLTDMALPSIHFGYLSPVMTHNAPDTESTSLALPLGVRLLLSEWTAGTDPHQYAYRDPYDDQQPGATTFIDRTPIRMNAAQATQSQSIVTTAAAPPIIACSKPDLRTDPRTIISSSQPGPVTRRRAGSLDDSDRVGLDIESDSFAPLVSTQVVPGPFGGRPPTVRKKAAPGKKRIGGF